MRPVAEPDVTTQPWWDATREHRLLIQRCDACEAYQHYPRAVCTACGAETLSFVEVSGRGTVYSFTVVQRAPHEAFTPPYTVALVRLAEGPVLLTNLTGEPACDAPVTLTWIDLPDGRALPTFSTE